MAKDAFYFSHDSNAKDDPKCVMLIEQLGMEGYGIFWVLIETLREQPEYKYPLALLPALARRFNTTHDKMRVVVCNYGLFTIVENEIFYSESLIRRMLQADSRREQARLAGLISAQKRRLLNSGSTDVGTDVERTLNDRSTKKKIKENKSKENKNIYTPEFEKFYAVYPRPECKRRTYTNWKTQIKDYDFVQLIIAAENYKASKAGIDIQFIKSSANFLGRERVFEDYLDSRNLPKSSVRTGADNQKAGGSVPQKGNFEQRKYDDSYFDGLYKEVGHDDRD